MTISEFYKVILNSLNDEYKNESAYIISEVLNINKSIIPFSSEIINLDKQKKIMNIVKKRNKGIFLEHILGYKYFYKDKFFVSKKTLIPRYDSEILLYIAESYKEFIEKEINIIDICSGTGNLAISMSRIFSKANIDAIDIFTTTLKKNIKHLNINNINVIKKDFLSFKTDKKYHIIISNPPYLSKEDIGNLDKYSKKYEPFIAFYGGKDGLKFYRKILEFSLSNLKENGKILLEVDYKYDKVMELFGIYYKTLNIYKDYNNLERVLEIYN